MIRKLRFAILILALSTFFHTSASETSKLKKQLVTLQLTDKVIIVLTREEYKKSCTDLYVNKKTCCAPFCNKFYCLPLTNDSFICTVKEILSLTEADARNLTETEKQAVYKIQQALYTQMQELDIELEKQYSPRKAPFEKIEQTTNFSIKKPWHYT